MQDILYLKKKKFNSKEVKHLTVSTLPELGMKFIWLEASQVPEFNKYIPDEWSLVNKKADRGFFWGILSTLKEEYVEQLMINCRELRA